METTFKKLSRLAGLCMGLFPVATICAEIQLPPNGSCEIHRSRDTYSAAEIGSMFNRPADASQILRNIRSAMEKDLMLQSGFYEKGNLLKFFNATQTKWSTPSDFRSSLLSWQQLTLTIDDRVFPGMTVGLLRSCVIDPGEQQPTHSASGRIVPTVSMKISFGKSAEFTVLALRTIFGTETREEMEYGVGTDGGRYVPTDKGFIDYEDLTKERDATFAIQRSSIRFFVKDNSLQARESGSRRKIKDSDEIAGLHMLVKGR